MIQYYLRLSFFCFFFVLSQDLKGQVIKPFEDYSKCMTGFLNEKGDTVFPAQFESTSYCIHRDSYKNRDSTTWIVNFHGRYGYLDSKGAWIFKPEYSRLEMWGDDYFFVEKNAKYGILSAKGKFILPIEYDSIHPYPWLSAGNKVGLISSFDGSWLVKPQYDSIYHAGKFECFLVKDNEKNPEKWLLINQKGKRLTQPIFDTTFYFSEYDNFVYAKSNGKIGTFSTKSYKWMTKPMYDAKALLSHELGMLFTKDDYVFVDWETGKSFGVEHDSVLFYVNDCLRWPEMFGDW